MNDWTNIPTCSLDRLLLYKKNPTNDWSRTALVFVHHIRFQNKKRTSIAFIISIFGFNHLNSTSNYLGYWDVSIWTFVRPTNGANKYYNKKKCQTKVDSLSKNFVIQIKQKNECSQSLKRNHCVFLTFISIA